jgi:hypothetical protein
METTLRCVAIHPIGGQAVHSVAFDVVADTRTPPADALMTVPASGKVWGILKLGIDNAALLATLKSGQHFKLTLVPVEPPPALPTPSQVRARQPRE